MTDQKPTNPKDLIGTDKVPLDLVPLVGMTYQALAHLEGHLKYGLVNWREAGVKASIYIAAAERHLQKFKEGEWADPASRVPHLGSVGACMNIIADAEAAGKLIDDRPRSSPGAVQRLEESAAVVRHLRKLFADKHPTHYTILGPVKVESAGVVASRASLEAAGIRCEAPVRLGIISDEGITLQKSSAPPETCSGGAYTPAPAPAMSESLSSLALHRDAAASELLAGVPAPARGPSAVPTTSGSRSCE